MDTTKAKQVAEPTIVEADKESKTSRSSNERSPSTSATETRIADWDGPNDPKNPRKWTNAAFYTHTILVSTLCLTSNLATTMYAPGAGQLARDFRNSDPTLIAMTVSIYLLGFALGPMILAPLSEVFGRLPIYHGTNAIFVAFLLACGFAPNVGSFLAFRFLSGFGASAPMTVGGGTIADLLANPGQDSIALRVFGLGPLLGPVIGPIVGGFVTQTIGWRWTFYILASLQGALSILGVAVLRETSGTVILARKARKLTKETGIPHVAANADPSAAGMAKHQVALRSLLRPIKMLLFLPIVLLLSLYTAFVFGLIYLLFTTFPDVFTTQYGFSPGVTGLAYLGLGAGMVMGLFFFTSMNARAVKKRGLGENGMPIPETYLPVMIYFSPLLPVGFFWYGWSSYYKTHWIVPILGTFFVGFGSFSIIMSTMAYLMMAYGSRGAASALAANNILRYLFATFIPLAAPAMYSTLGLGWGNSLLGFLCILFAPVPILFYRYGEKLRMRFAIPW